MSTRQELVDSYINQAQKFDREANSESRQLYPVLRRAAFKRRKAAREMVNQ